MGTNPVLIARTQKGDLRAWFVLVKTYQDAVFAHCTGLLGSVEKGLEAARETFLVAHARIEQVTDAERFAPWLRRQSEQVCAGTAVGAPGELEAVARLLALPKEEEREVAFQHYLACQTPEAIALFLDIPLSTVQARLAVIVRRLKKRGSREIEASLARERPSLTARLPDEVIRLLGSAPARALPPRARPEGRGADADPR